MLTLLVYSRINFDFVFVKTELILRKPSHFVQNSSSIKNIKTVGLLHTTLVKITYKILFPNAESGEIYSITYQFSLKYPKYITNFTGEATGPPFYES